jgi:PAS domain S-box-containing protein
VNDNEKSREMLLQEIAVLRHKLTVAPGGALPQSEAESALWESEERFRKIFEHSNDAIYLIDPESKAVIDANPSASRMLGYDRAELLKLTVADIHPHEMPQMTAFAQSVFMNGRGWTNELSCITKTGEAVPAEISASLVEIGGYTCMIALVRDTSERRQAEMRIRTEAARADALAHSASRLNAQLDLSAVLSAVCEETANALDVPAAVVLFFDPEKERFYPAATWGLPQSFMKEYTPNPRSVYEQHPQPYHPQIVVPNLRLLPNLPNAALFARHNIHAIALTSLNREDNLLGALSAYALDESRVFSEDDISLLRSLADQAALAIRNAKLYEQSRHFAALEERQRLARELHDSVTQSLYGMTLYAGATQDLLAANDIQAAKNQLDEMQEMIQGALGELRLLIYQLRPLSLEDGLVNALQERLETVENRSGLRADLEVSGDLNLSDEQEEALYRITLEALNNVIKHARATAVSVSLKQTENRLYLSIQDNGRGFDPELVARKRGWGLRGILERVERLQGRVDMQSAPGKGATITVEVPCNE